jgi:TRAP transporter TAXI family solute receptor
LPDLRRGFLLIRRPGLIALLCALCAASAGAAGPSPRTLYMGTAPVVGVYFPAGGAICAMVNRHRAETGLRCVIESTEGSVANLEALRSGDEDMAIVQSDWQYYAVKGLGPFKSAGPFDGLRALFAIHGEPLTLMVRKNAGIVSLADLKGKRVNIGPKGSGQRVLADLLIRALGWKDADFASLSEIDANLQTAALCDGQIDAFLMPMSHPNGAVEEAAGRCGALLVPLTGPAVDKLMADKPYLAKDVIPAGTYPGNPNAIATFGPRATLLATKSMPESVGYGIVKAVFEDFDRFTAMHPSFRNLTPAEMVGPGNTAPLQAGAARYFRERGWLK